MVDGSGLENRQARKRLEGSNPSLSAIEGPAARVARDPAIGVLGRYLSPLRKPAEGRRAASRRRAKLLTRGEVAEWLKAQVC